MAMWQSNDQSGFTLLEILVALIILMVGAMAVLTVATSAISHNMENMLKDEAEQIADAKMRVVKANTSATAASPFQSLSTTTTQMSKLRSKATPYTIILSSTATGGDSNQLRVLVTWKYKNVTKQYEFSSLKSY